MSGVAALFLQQWADNSDDGTRKQNGYDVVNVQSCYEVTVV